MKVLITGGNGFLGSHLAEALSQKNVEVRCLVLTGEKHPNLDNLPIEIAFGNICDRDSLAAALRDVDVIYHLAGVKRAWKEETYYRVNYDGTRNLIEAVLQNGTELKKFIFVSSQAAAGPSAGGRLLTENDPCNPPGHYGKSKLAAEKYLLSQAGKIPLTILRLSPVFGCHQSDDSMVGLLVRFARRGVVPQTMADGPHMNLIHIDDTILALCLAGQSRTADGQVYFITSQRTYTWQEITQMAFAAWGRRGGVMITFPKYAAWFIGGLYATYRRLLGRPYKFIYELIIHLYQPHWACSGEKAKKELSFVPQVSIDSGLNKIIACHKAQP